MNALEKVQSAPKRLTLFNPGRHKGKRARTRVRIMDAAAELLAAQLYERASISDIAETADVAYGTFYLHFKDKVELAEVTALEVCLRISELLDEMLSASRDAAERNGRVIRHVIELCAYYPPWGVAIAPVISRVLNSENPLFQRVRSFIQRGVDTGVFDTELDDMLISAALAIAATGIEARLREGGSPVTGSRAAELILRTLGADHEYSRQIAWAELDQVDYDTILLPQSSHDRASRLLHMRAKAVVK
jgi:AcrR family transcriptional regulator